MNISVLGTGIVGTTIGNKLIELGHQVRMGSRTAQNEKGLQWVQAHAAHASLGTFNDSAAFGEIIFNCTKGTEAIQILESIDAVNLKSKILIDLSNPLDFSNGFPPTLSICNTTSLGEEIQKLFPEAPVVKTLNTMWCGLMVDPGLVSNGDHTNFICGNHADAKQQVIRLLNEFGWNTQNILDLGDISAARGMEMYLPLWLRIYSTSKNNAFNLKIIG